MSERSDYLFSTLDLFLSTGVSPQESMQLAIQSYRDTFFPQENDSIEAEPERRTHSLKTWPEYFSVMISGEKSFELRQNDRDFRVGDILKLNEWDPETRKYTGRSALRRVTYLIQGAFGLQKDTCAMSVEFLTFEEEKMERDR